jgi:Mrp family chromosome partitioning ATPase
MRRRDLIERASVDFAAARLEPGDTDAPGRPSSRAARQFAVDRDRLRALSLITPDGERTPLAESFRRIKRQILEKVEKPKPGDPPANLVLVTSALAGEGKTFCAINLAISMALERDRTILLVDADVAKHHHDRIVMFDSPPLLAASEAGALASQVGQIVMVVEAGRTSEAVLKHALGRIDTSRVTGLVLNKVEAVPLEYSYGAYG